MIWRERWIHAIHSLCIVSPKFICVPVDPGTGLSSAYQLISNQCFSSSVKRFANSPLFKRGFDTTLQLHSKDAREELNCLIEVSDTYARVAELESHSKQERSFRY